MQSPETDRPLPAEGSTGATQADEAGVPTEIAAPTPLERLKREPSRFSIDQAAAVIAPGRDPVEIAFRTSPRLGAPGGEVSAPSKDEAGLVTPTFGLIGVGGVLPRHYTALVDAEQRKRSTALHGFLDLLSRRLTGLFVKAGAKYRPTRNPRLADEVLAASVGLGTGHLVSRLQTPRQALLYHAGTLSSRTRSAERLRGMLCEETGSEVRIVEFAGSWVRLPSSEQSRLAGPGSAGSHMILGDSMVAGQQVWDPAARFHISLGPMSYASFCTLLPGTPLHTRLVELTRLHVGVEVDFALNPILEAAEVPGLCLPVGEQGAARLGWTSWLTSPRPRRAAAADALLGPAPA